jgi:hypothetical protein
VEDLVRILDLDAFLHGLLAGGPATTQPG